MGRSCRATATRRIPSCSILRREKYLGLGRMGFGRTIALSESDDALHWSVPTRVLACDALDGPGGQIYGMPTDRYEGLLVGMFWMYREGLDAKIDTQLAMSRDGRHWRRVADRQTFLPNAPEGSWDDGMSRAGRGINVVGDTIYLHYSMVNGPHRSTKYPTVTRKFPPAIGLATLRRDGFVSLDAGADAGTLVTRPFTLPQGDLNLNTDAANGRIDVEIVDTEGHLLLALPPVSGDQPRCKIAAPSSFARSPQSRRCSSESHYVRRSCFRTGSSDRQNTCAIC